MHYRSQLPKIRSTFGEKEVEKADLSRISHRDSCPGAAGLLLPRSRSCMWRLSVVGAPLGEWHRFVIVDASWGCVPKISFLLEEGLSEEEHEKRMRLTLINNLV